MTAVHKAAVHPCLSMTVVTVVNQAAVTADHQAAVIAVIGCGALLPFYDCSNWLR